MRHKIKHHVNRPILHWGLFTDAQIMPAAGMFTLAAGWVYAGGGGLVARMVVAALMLLPVGVVAADNSVGGLVTDRFRALLRWHRNPGIFEPGMGEIEGYGLKVDTEDQLVLEREQMAHVDLEMVFAPET